MKTILLVITTSLLVTGCGQSFLKKPHQSAAKFAADKNYCRSEANGMWRDQTGNTTVGIRSKKMGHQSYEDCMRQLGYQQDLSK